MINKKQLREILDKKDLVDYFLGLSKSELIDKFGATCAVMKDFNQKNPHHCYNLLEHCLHAAECIEINSDMDFLLKTAALFHDVAKPIVAQEKQGRLVFYGHAQKSAVLMKPILSKMGFAREECDYILFWIEHHDDFIPYTDDSQKCGFGSILITEENVASYLDKLNISKKDLQRDFIQGLLRLCFADISSQSEEVYFNGVLVDSKKGKLRRLKLIESHFAKLIHKF